jgi:hypothetical protein
MSTVANVSRPMPRLEGVRDQMNRSPDPRLIEALRNRDGFEGVRDQMNRSPDPRIIDLLGKLPKNQFPKDVRPGNNAMPRPRPGGDLDIRWPSQISAR